MSSGAVTRSATLALGAAAVAYGLLAADVAGRYGDGTTYAGRSAAAALVEVGAGWMLIAAGLAAWLLRRNGAVGALAAGAGFAWFAADWIGWQTGPDAVRALAFAAQGITAAAIVQLALRAPSSAWPSTVTRALVAATWTATAGIAIGRVLFYDPFADPACVTWCSANPLLAHGSLAIAHVLDHVELALAVFVTVAVAIHAARRPSRATPAARHGLWAVVLPALLFLAAWTVRAAMLAGGSGENPADPVLAVAFAVRAAALAALAIGLTWSLGRAARGALAVRRLARRPAGDPDAGSLEGTLMRATGDPTLRVAFALGDERWVDGEGLEVEAPRRRPYRAVATILSAGEPVAAVLHDPGVLDGSMLRSEIGNAAQLAVDNARLQAQSRAQLRELKASRSRIVETGDAERRALERDLHDGAQQRLVGLSIAVRMARSALDRARETRAAASLEEADASLHDAIAELRELARGIHPVELTEEGLAAALETLADRAAVPVRIGELPAERMPTPVETAVYVLVEEVVRRAAARHERVTIDVRARRTGTSLVVEAIDPGEPSPDLVLADLLAVADRIGALDGRLAATPASPAGTSIRAQIPCA